MSVVVEVNLSNNIWEDYNIITPFYIKKVLNLILVYIPNLKKVDIVELSVLLTSDKGIRKLNKKFRNKDCATNVLSFPNLTLDYKTLLDFNFNDTYMYLGDVAFAYETIINEAMQQNMKFVEYFTHLLIHAILHLLGFIHDNKEDYLVMRKFERLLLLKLKKCLIFTEF